MIACHDNSGGFAVASVEGDPEHAYRCVLAMRCADCGGWNVSYVYTDDAAEADRVLWTFDRFTMSEPAGKPTVIVTQQRTGAGDVVNRKIHGLKGGRFDDVPAAAVSIWGKGGQTA